MGNNLSLINCSVVILFGHYTFAISENLIEFAKKELVAPFLCLIVIL